MSIMQHITIAAFWVFFGLLTSYLAGRKGKNQFLWFFIGLFLGCLGVLAIVLAPTKPKAQKSQPPKPPLQDLAKRNEAWSKMWYYMDTGHIQQGPVEFQHIIQAKLTPTTYVWGEGMAEWKKLSELPELLQEIQQGN